MSCYLIPIGGTGVRVMKALVNLCMTGCFAGTQFKVMCIDSDDVNGDIKELETLIRNYKNVPSDMFPELKLVKIEGEERCIWSPLSGDKKKDKRSAMKDMIAESQMSKDAKKVLQYLYTKPEREKILEGGFYGHTSIGSYFMAQEVVKDGKYTDVWHDFFDGIKTDDKIFIIGSIFGGTGASGVPTIARLIKDNDVTADIPIGAMFVMPYFKPQRKDDELSELPIDWTTFTTKTKTALSFYLDQKFDEVFDTMYFIGEDADAFMTVEYNDCGIKQKNKANPIEVFAATSVLDFIKQKPNDTLVTKFLTKEVGENGLTPLTQEMLNEIADSNCFANMSKFLKFSILYNKYLYPCICEKFSAEKWFSFYKKIEKQDADSLKQICSNYIEWIKELIIKNDERGHMDFSDENDNLVWFWFKNYAQLYDASAISGKREGLISKHMVYNLDELEDLKAIIKGSNQKAGKDIITEFANEIAPEKSKRKGENTSDLKQLMIDIMELC